MHTAASHATATVTSATKEWLRALELTKSIAARPQRVLPVVIEELAERLVDKPALLADGESLSFYALAERAGRYGCWALEQGLGKGDVVCLLMPNRPEFMAVWLGITRVGGIVALLNTNLVGPSLAHCIDVVAPKHIIVAEELSDSLRSARPHLRSAPLIWCYGARGSDMGDIAAEIEKPLQRTLSPAAAPSLSDRALYIYTSGTSGLPKAANVSHQRILTWSLWFAGLMNTGAGDRMYNCLPMYHSIGGVVATGAVLVSGGSVVIADRFSASRFWDDVTRWDCSLFQYIGELCRYLLRAPAHPHERGHRIRLACGNGLRAELWHPFKERFQIPRILEFYAATEGNVTLFNCEEKTGAIGRIPAFVAHRSPVVLVRHDAATGEIARDQQGRCIRCGPNETGEALGRIASAGKAGSAFEGYADAAATRQKVVRDVLEKGDAWFRTGDLMRQDEAGFFYFVDRIGDTLRWKGENVSTAEVTAATTGCCGVRDACVFGVEVPGAEGRAGMAVLVVDDSFDLDDFRRHLAARLPAYAHPVFLRLTRSISVTSTFKQAKNELAREGYDPRAVSDPLYFNDPVRQAFVPLDAGLHERIREGSVRL